MPRERGPDIERSHNAKPAPEVIMAANGIYWRRDDDGLSMVPTSDDNDPVLTPYAVYRLVGYEDHEGTFTPVERKCPDCWGGRPKWAGTMPTGPCSTCGGKGKVRDA